MTLPMPSCLRCVHFGPGLTCRAFPDRIPNTILFALHSHKAPYAGERDGIRFTPRRDARREGERATYSALRTSLIIRIESPILPS